MAPLPRRAFLGAELPGDAEAFVDGGMKVVAALEGGMAARAGLRGGEVIREIAGAPVRSLAELAAALRLAGALDTTTIDGREVDVVRAPLEAGAIYGELAVDGARLRTLAVVPDAPRALVLVLQGIACETIEQPIETPLGGTIAGWAAAGIASLRFDKRGVGDSEGGPCDLVDFATELADARAAVTFARERASELGVPLVVFGHSVGGIIAAQLARDIELLVVCGTPRMRWLDCLGDSLRRQLALRAAPADVVAREIGKLATLAERGELNGRSAAYHRQLHALDLEAAWAAVTARVLVLRGEHDWVVRAEDQTQIAAAAPGRTLVDLPGLDHLFGWHADRAASLRDYGIGSFDPAVVRATVAWLADIIGA